MNDKKKRRAYMRLIISTLILSALISILIGSIRRGGFPTVFSFGSCYPSTYPFSDKYTAGNTSIAADKLEALEIDWISGSIQIETYDGDTIELIEEDSDSLSESDRVHSYYEDGTLMIQFRKSEVFSFHIASLSKSLVVRIPQKFSSAYIKKLEIDNVSADVTVNGLQIQKFSADSVSGDIRVNGAVENLESDSVSGNTTLTSFITPNEIETDTVSGNVTISVPADSQFSIDLDTVSGELSNTFPTTHNIKGRQWKFDSVSGNVTIQDIGEQ